MSSIDQSSGIASSDSTRCTPSICSGPTAAASSATRSMPCGGKQSRVVVDEKDEIVVAERLGGLLVDRHVRVVVGEERVDRLLVAHALARHGEHHEQEHDRGKRHISGREQERESRSPAPDLERHQVP